MAESYSPAQEALADSLHGLSAHGRFAPSHVAVPLSDDRSLRLEWAGSILDRLAARGYRLIVDACAGCQHSWRSHGLPGRSEGCYAKGCSCRTARPADLDLDAMPRVDAAPRHFDAGHGTGEEP